MSNPNAPKTAADHRADNKLSAEAILIFAKAEQNPDVVKQRDESWVLWRSRREAREAQEARIAKEKAEKAEAAKLALRQHEARIAKEEAATLAFFQKEAREEAATEVLLQQARDEGWA